MNTKYFNVKLIVAFVLISLSAMSCTSFAKTPESLDRLLINSLAKDDLKTARKLLEKGANPEAMLGERARDHAVCTAIDSRTSKKLELLVEYGASPNAYWKDAPTIRRTPLVCAVQLLNFEAFRYLLANGADPSVDLQPESREKFRNEQTAFTHAIGYKTYPMAFELLQFYELHSNEIRYATRTLGSSPNDEVHPWTYARVGINEWLKQRVPGFTPRPASPGPDRDKSECLFSLRDIRERVKKGSICFRPEDQ